MTGFVDLVSDYNSCVWMYFLIIATSVFNVNYTEKYVGSHFFLGGVIVSLGENDWGVIST